MDINKYVDEIGRLFNGEMHGFRSEVFIIVNRIRAEARAETLREAAERAVAWYRSGQLIPAHMKSFSIETLRAAILDDKQGDKPWEEKR